MGLRLADRRIGESRDRQYRGVMQAASFRFIASFDVGICGATTGDMAILTAIKVIVSSAL